MKVSYNWLNTFFKEGELPPVSDIEQKLIFHAYEIEGVDIVKTRDGDDYLLDVDVLPNRSSDSMSHRGIAREIATQFSLTLGNDPLTESNKLEPVSEKIALKVDNEEVCPIHTLALIEGVDVKESPQWLRERLEVLGQRSINNVIDATNYIMYGLGQPSHVFDFDKLTETDGVRGVRVRNAKDGEELILLGGKEVTLTTNMNVLADLQDDTPLDVAGVKGGVHAELDEGTVNVLVTSAKFHPTITRKTAQALRLRTDASVRYENEVPDQMPKIAIREVVKLILEIAGGTLDGYKVVGDADSENPQVKMKVSELVKHLGVEISDNEVASIFDRLGFIYEQSGDEFKVTAPFERLDITIKEEIMEEVGRVYGYANIAPQPLPETQTKPPILQKYAMTQRLHKALTSLGYKEVMLYSMRGNGEVKLKNSLNTQTEYLRGDLKSGVVEALESNERTMPMLGEYGAVKIFEIGNIFTKDSEDMHLCIGARAIGKEKDTRTMAELVSIKEALETQLGITLPEPDGETLEVDIQDLMQGVEIDSYERVGSVRDGLQFSPMSPYQFMTRDIAMWAPEGVDETVITEVIEKHCGELVQRIDKFDEFAKDGRVSLAFHIIFQSMEKTLTDDEVGEIMKKVEAELGGMDGFEVR